ncbi:hypothetical protein PHYBOEH_002081 [Phytophthora boehmeriae]|uniref:Sister chromatid cohesion protein PDS5 n=1 Tax=Phytophthora boehmeriae TaxID=109152 RepID=A0A8T1X5C3_9STRA|nr:hypothetical protein PHYBOEH_002081 [Phytophthora boehmeriae]
MTKRRTRSLRPNEVAGAQSHETPVSSRRVATRGTPDREDVLSGTFLTAAGRNVSLLTKRLKLTWQTLQNASNRQEQQDEGLATSRDASRQWNPLLKELLQSKICRHTDPNVQSLVGCCLVEIMRVHAPDSPFQSSEELYLGFTLLCNQVRALTQDKEEDSRATTRDLHCLHILESLATVKSCLLVVGLDYTRQDEEPMMVQLFQTLFDTMSGGHSVKVENLMLSIMVACIEESDAIEQPLLDVILSPLVDAAPAEAEKTESAASPSHMARELIRRTSEHLQSPMSHFFNSILIDAPGSLRSSELKEYVYTLIYEVHKIDPSLLLYVLPNVCLQLQVDEVATRSEAIGLMGKLFASSHADYGHEFMKNFRDFLGRFRDASKEIRLQMVQISVQIWEHKTELASLLEKEFILRLSDPEWEVRQLVVHELCDLAANQLDLISEECLRAVGERMKDKKNRSVVDLLVMASDTLPELFAPYISDKTWTSNAVLAANFRAAASCGLMKIVRNRQLEASITVSQWHLLGFTMQDASEDVRRKFLKKLMSHMIKQPMLHPHKYLSYLALAGTESSTSLKKSVRSLLKIAIERMRRMFDAASSRQSELTCSPNQPSVSALMVPEYSLPYVIHLLAHHPEFPGMLVERTSSATILHSALWTDQLAFLGFFLDGLVSANARAADNISFLLQMLTKLSQCHDVTSPDSKNIYPLIDSVVVLLKKKIKNQSNLKPFPGKIFLPKHLYSPGRPTSSSTVMSHVRIEPEAPETLGSASTTYDTGSRLDSTLLSPIKPMDFAAHFMKLNSPPGSSLKRKRSLTSDGKQTPSAGLGAKRDNNDPNALIGHSNFTTPLRRQSLMRKGQPEGRTYADDSSDSSAESDTFLTPGTGIIAEEDEVEEQTGVLSKKRKTIDGTPEVTAEGTPVQEKPRLRSSRRLRQQA